MPDRAAPPQDASLQTAKSGNALPTQRDIPADLSGTRLGARKLLEALTTSGCNAQDIAKITKAMDLMFELHKDQQRPDGQPYVRHTLLVAQILARRFDVTDPAAVVAALLHDAPEDQTPRISKLLGDGSSITQREAIALLSQHVGVNKTKVAEHLLHLTNPDFKALAQELKTSQDSNALQRSKGYHLFALTLPASQRDPETVRGIARDMPSRDIKNTLYLGHWIEILNGDPITRAIKLADFYTNGLQRNKLHEHLDSLAGGSPEKYRTQQFAENLRRKYGPVVSLIGEHLSQAISAGGNLVSPRGDMLIGRQIGKVSPLYLQPYPGTVDREP